MGAIDGEAGSDEAGCFLFDKHGAAEEGASSL